MPAGALPEVEAVRKGSATTRIGCDIGGLSSWSRARASAWSPELTATRAATVASIRRQVGQATKQCGSARRYRAAVTYWVLKAVLSPVLLPALAGAGRRTGERPRRPGPAMLAANHQSFCDSLLPCPWWCGAGSPIWPRPSTSTSWKTAWFFRAAGQIPIRRGGGDESQRALDTAMRRARGRRTPRHLPRGHPGPGRTRPQGPYRGGPARPRLRGAGHPGRHHRHRGPSSRREDGPCDHSAPSPSDSGPRSACRHARPTADRSRARCRGCDGPMRGADEARRGVPGVHRRPHGRHRRAVRAGVRRRRTPGAGHAADGTPRPGRARATVE